ncbi:MAG: chorismate synthase, partial [Flavobacteriaceae bacterium]|nr:chorismate synthase [Flavobacteriaceae bacterium]
SSARETACRVVAGAIAKQILSDIKITAFVSSVGKIKIEKHYSELDFSEIEKNPVRCADSQTALLMEDHIKETRKEGDTVGGVVSCVIENTPIGLGEPVFDKLHADLGKAMLSINAVKGFEFGSGFDGTKLKGSEHNDSFNSDGKTKTNNSGGIQGGISNGMDIYFNVAFKPVSTIMKAQETIDSNNNVVEMSGKGRHDPCVVPRAVPIVEAMAALVLVDFYLINRTIKL